MDNYEKDPLCGFDFTNNGYYILFSVIKAACSKKIISAVPKDLPVYFVAGELDPVGDYGKGVEKLCRKLDRYGKNVSMILYRGCRHEIVNDICAPQLFEDLSGFIAENTAK